VAKSLAVLRQLWYNKSMQNKYNIAFNTNFVASLTGASVAQLNAWDRQEIVSPSILKAEGKGSIRLYSFKDIIEVKTVVYLRDNKTPLPEIKKAVNYLQTELDFSRPLSELVLLSNGKHIFCTPDSKINDPNAKWLIPNKYGQLVFNFFVPLGAITKDITDKIKDYEARIDEAEQEREAGTLVPWEDIRGKYFEISNKNDKKGRKRRLA